MFPKQVFKVYDIRGLTEGELSEDLAYRIGRAYGVFLRESSTVIPIRQSAGEESLKVVVGQDMRATSPKYAKEVIRGLNDEGLNVVDIGLASTPLFNFACTFYPEHLAGIMVTASHNPAQYNGFKMTLHDGTPVGGKTGMDTIRDLAEKNEWTSANAENVIPAKAGIQASITQKDVFPDYLNKILSIVKPEEIKPLKIVIDAGNGMAAVTFVELLKKLPVQVEYLFLKPDGNFPNHEANPLKTETLKTLQEKVKATGADFGFALDGDADRMGLVDENGEVVEASFVGALAGLEILREHPGVHMLYDLRSSKIQKEVWEANGATTGMCPVGHANIKKMMKDQKAEFASELSLHLYFHSMCDVESTDLALLYFLRLLSRSGKKLSELIAPLKKYFHSGEINFKVADKEKVLNNLRVQYGDAKITELDGLSFEYPTWWFNVRASNTEPVLRLNLEADTKGEMEEKLVNVKNIING
ncbi:MAG: phosphomannomutase/phosphoglucomutase [Candidatus Magasanikbacteria bacterium]